jgi:hypothetical protein
MQIWLALRMHRRLLAASYAFDLVYLAACLSYLFLPLSVKGVGHANMGFLGLAALGAVMYHVHAIRACSASAAHYLTIPLRRRVVLAVVSVAAMAPFCIVFPLLAALLHPEAVSALGMAYYATGHRVFHCLGVFFFIKTLPPPAVTLSHKHPALLIVLPLGIMLAWMAATLASEIAPAAAVKPVVFLGLVFAFHVAIVSRATI